MTCSPCCKCSCVLAYIVSTFMIFYSIFSMYEASNRYPKEHPEWTPVINWSWYAAIMFFIYHFENLIINGMIAPCFYRHSMLVALVDKKEEASVEDWKLLKGQFMFRGVIYGMFGGVAALVESIMIFWCAYGIYLFVKYPITEDFTFCFNMSILMANTLMLALEMVIGIAQISAWGCGCLKTESLMDLGDIFPGMQRPPTEEQLAEQEGCMAKFNQFEAEVNNIAKNGDEADDYRIIMKNINNLTNNEENQNLKQEEEVDVTKADEIA